MAQSVITLDVTISGTDTNSYLSLADAEVLLHERPFHGDWDKITEEDEKKAALIWATRILSHMQWKGYPTDIDQKQAFPRTGIYDLDQRDYPDDEYPDWLTVATSEIAFYIATDDRLSESGTEGFSEIKVASISVKIDKMDRSGLIPEYIMDAMRPWLQFSAKFNAEVLRV